MLLERFSLCRTTSREAKLHKVSSSYLCSNISLKLPNPNSHSLPLIISNTTLSLNSSEISSLLGSISPTPFPSPLFFQKKKLITYSFRWFQLPCTFTSFHVLLIYFKCHHFYNKYPPPTLFLSYNFLPVPSLSFSFSVLNLHPISLHNYHTKSTILFRLTYSSTLPWEVSFLFHHGPVSFLYNY